MAINKITDDMKNTLVTFKMEYDTVSLAIQKANDLGVPEEEVQRLVKLKGEYKTQLERASQDILDNMVLRTNIVALPRGWYGIRYLNSKANAVLHLDMLGEDHSILERDCRYDRELNKNDLDLYLPACVDTSRLEVYKIEIESRANDHISLYHKPLAESQDVVVPEEEEGEGQVSISFHAGFRYVQRVLKLHADSEARATKYYNENVQAIKQDILDRFNKSKKVWEGEDDIEYFMDEDNIMYVVGNNNMITLYEEDFGFAKEINRMIVLSQVEVLAKKRQAVAELREEHNQLATETNNKLSIIEGEIGVLKAKIELLEQERTNLVTNRATSEKRLDVAVMEFNKEFNKLFKK